MGKASLMTHRGVGRGFLGFMMRLIFSSGIILALQALGPWCGGACAATLSAGTTALGIISPGSGQMTRGEFLMLGWDVGDDTRLGVMVERSRIVVGAGFIQLNTTSLLLERRVANKTTIGMGLGGVQVGWAMWLAPVIDLYGRADVLDLGSASLGVLLGIRTIVAGGGISSAVPGTTLRLALIGTGSI